MSAENCTFVLGKRYVRGKNIGKYFTETIKLNRYDNIYGHLWDLTDSYDRKHCDYIVEWYKQK